MFQLIKEKINDTANSAPSGGGGNPILSAGIIIAILYFAAPILVTFLFSVFLFLLLDPWVTYLEHHHVRRLFGAIAMVTLALALILLTGNAFYQSLRKVTSQIPSYSEKVISLSEGFHSTTNRLFKGTNVIINEFSRAPINDEVQKVQVVTAQSDSPVMAFLLKGMNSVMSILSLLFFIPLIALFLLLEKDFLCERLLEIVKDHAMFESACEEIKHMIRGFFVGNFVVGFFMTLVFACVFKSMHLDNAFSLALFAGFLNLIPVFGILFGAIIPALQAFMQFDGFTPVFLVCAASALIHLVGNNLVMPRFIGTRINVNTTAALVGFLVWGNIWGALGLFLTIPLMAILRILLLTHERTRPFANLISETPVQSHARLYIGQES